jgi:predicted PurR-regulated permease PerM
MVVLAAVLLWMLSKVMVVVVPLLIALFPSAALAPAQRWLVSVGWPRAVAASALLLGLLALVGGVIAGPIPLLSAQLPVLVQSIGAAAGQLQQLLDRATGGHAGDRLGGVNSLTQQLYGWLLGGDPVSGTLSLASTALNVLSGVVLTILTVFFLLYRGATVSDVPLGLMPARYREGALVLGARLWHTLGTYVRAQLLVGLLDAVLIGIGLLALGVPLAVPLAMLIFVGAQVPFLGAIVSGSLAVLVGLAHGGLGLALGVLGVVAGVEFVEGHFLQPLIMSRTTQLPALAVIVSVAVGTTLLGVLGALVAVPVLSMLVETVRFLRQREEGGTPRRVPGPRLRAANPRRPDGSSAAAAQEPGARARAKVPRLRDAGPRLRRGHGRLRPADRRRLSRAGRGG